jgi:hypothetical protein
LLDELWGRIFAGGAMVYEAVGESWGDGLPSDHAALLAKPDQAAVEALELDAECATTTAGGLGVSSRA